jgi:S1-C subfamily serine protease
MGVAGIAPAAETPTSFPPAAERIFAPALPRLLQIRTLVGGTGTQSSLGSAFFVTSDGLAVTNYHVVAQAALEPRTYKLEYTAADGTHGEVGILAIDLPNDLAVVRIDKRETPFFAFAEPALVRNLAKGERLFSMGNPLDLGFTIVEGTYNGLVERSYNERIHFTGAINPGVSGGPAAASACAGSERGAAAGLSRGDRPPALGLAVDTLQVDRGQGIPLGHSRILSSSGDDRALVQLLGANQRKRDSQAECQH